MPALKGLMQEEHLFYGTVSHAAIPSIFGGSNIPFFDKTIFQINGDDQANFILYASEDMLNNMAEWYSFASRDAGDIPLEISASRILFVWFFSHQKSQRMPYVASQSGVVASLTEDVIDKRCCSCFAVRAGNTYHL